MQPSRSQPARVSARSRVHAAFPRSKPSLATVVSIVTLAFGAALAGCTMPTHPDSAAPPTDPYNPAATQLLDDTQWQLTSWTNADGKSRPVPASPAGAAGGSVGGAPITLNFSTLGGQRKANGFSGCNRFTGTYDLAGGELSFGPLASTRMACAPGPGSALEQPFLQGLTDIEKTGVQMQPPQQLQITLKNGDVMTFTRGAQP
ncbi:META domain-containing protein [Caballeronia sp. dw_19]|uniref:META domain-containing protein n=1 Tax=Caballeronia sp. dw_19 TaxID=2719791 RepID=UPI001BD3BAD5|nr:META domain-containing protein [Caballeronia sp. dw_19]